MTEALICYMAGDSGVPVSVLSDDLHPELERVPSGTSVPRVSYVVAAPDPILSCAAVIPFLDDALMTEGEARDVSSGRRTRNTNSLLFLLPLKSIDGTLTDCG